FHHDPGIRILKADVEISRGSDSRYLIGNYPTSIDTTGNRTGHGVNLQGNRPPYGPDFLYIGTAVGVPDLHKIRDALDHPVREIKNILTGIDPYFKSGVPDQPELIGGRSSIGPDPPWKRGVITVYRVRIQGDQIKYILVYVQFVADRTTLGIGDHHGITALGQIVEGFRGICGSQGAIHLAATDIINTVIKGGRPITDRGGNGTRGHPGGTYGIRRGGAGRQ